MILFKKLFIILFILCTSDLAFADKIMLKSGNIIEGKVTRRLKKSVELEVGLNEPMIIKYKDIESIHETLNRDLELDKIILTSGHAVEGKIYAKMKEGVKFDIGGTIIEYKYDEIASIYESNQFNPTGDEELLSEGDDYDQMLMEGNSHPVKTYYGVKYDLSYIGVDYRPTNIIPIITEIESMEAPDGKGQIKISGVKIVSEEEVVRGAEMRKTSDGKYVLFLSAELLTDNYIRDLRKRILDTLFMRREITPQEKAQLKVDQKRRETLISFIDVGEEGEEGSDSLMAKVAKAPMKFLGDVEDYMDGKQDRKDRMFIGTYYQSFDEAFNENKIIKDMREAKTLDYDGEVDDVALAQTHIHRGHAYEIKGDYEAALNDYKKAIELNVLSVEAYNYRGNLYLLLEDPQKAIEDFNKAIKINTLLPELFNNRGYAYELNKEYEKAITDYTKAIEIDPLFTDAYNNRGFVYQEIGYIQEAIEDFTSAINIDPNLAQAYHNRSVTRYIAKQYEGSWSDIQMARNLGFEVDREFLHELKRALENR